MNAYRLAQMIEDRQLGRLVKISKPVVYKSCKRLGKAGFLDSHTLRETEMPEKTVYTVNAAGRAHFLELMRHFSSQINHFHLDFNSFIWNLGRVGHGEGLAMLETLLGTLRQIQQFIVVHEREDVAQANFGTRMVVKQYRMLFNTLVNWAEEALTEYRQLEQ